MKVKDSSQKVKRANILLKADPSSSEEWNDPKITEALGCRTKTVKNIRQRFVEEGFAKTLNGSKRINTTCQKTT